MNRNIMVHIMRNKLLRILAKVNRLERAEKAFPKSLVAFTAKNAPVALAQIFLGDSLKKSNKKRQQYNMTMTYDFTTGFGTDCELTNCQQHQSQN